MTFRLNDRYFKKTGSSCCSVYYAVFIIFFSGSQLYCAIITINDRLTVKRKCISFHSSAGWGNICFQNVLQSAPGGFDRAAPRTAAPT